MTRGLLFRCSGALLAVTFALFFSARVCATPRTWDANGAIPANGSFNVAANWNPDGVPAVGDAAIFNPSGTYTVTLSADAASDSATFTGTESLQSDSATVRTYTLTTGVANLSLTSYATVNLGATGNPVAVNTGMTNIGSDAGAGFNLLILRGQGTSLSTGTLNEGYLPGGGQTGRIEVRDNAVLSVNGAAIVRHANGLTVDGGQVVMGSFSNFAETVNFISGSISVGNDFLVALTGPLGAVPKFSAGKSLTVGGTTTVSASTATLTINGGSLTTGALVNSGGNINFSNGTLGITGASGLNVGANGPFGVSLVVGNAQTLNVTHGVTIDPGSFLTLDGGTLRANSLTANGTFAFHGGVLDFTNGGTISGVSNLIVPAYGEFRVAGFAASRITGSTGSTITATGTVLLGDSTNVDGFYTNGAFATGSNTVILADANDAVFDSAATVTIGTGANPGAISASNGVTLDFGGNVTGFGAINSPNSPDRPFINNGHVAGNNLVQQITLSGYVKGVGTLDNVNIMGTYAPGFSPATVTGGSVAYNGTLQIELGGTTPGSFDQINHVLGSGIAQLGGTLDVELINDFQPTVGNLFPIITAVGGVVGTFNTSPSELPELPPGLSWAINYHANDVTLQVISLLPGDYNGNGTVDAADYTVWRDTFGATGPGLAADGDGDNAVTLNDFNVWKSNFGMHAGSGSGGLATGGEAPEPGSLFLATTAAVSCLIFATRKGYLGLAGEPPFAAK